MAKNTLSLLDQDGVECASRWHRRAEERSGGRAVAPRPESCTRMPLGQAQWPQERRTVWREGLIVWAAVGGQ